MALSLHTLPTEVLRNIGAHLRQSDFIALSDAEKNLRKNVYPEHVTFRESVLRPEYLESFLSWLQHKDGIRSLDVTLFDTCEWNRLAPHYLDGKIYEDIRIYPTHPEKMCNIVYIPPCNNPRSGFAGVHVNTCVIQDRLYLDIYEANTDMEIPHLRLPETIRKICIGQVLWKNRPVRVQSGMTIRPGPVVRGLDRIPTSMSLVLTCMLPDEEFLHLAKFQQSVELCRVNIGDEAFVFEATELRLGVEALPMVAKAPNCTKLVVAFDGDVAGLSMSREVFPRLESVRYRGCVYDRFQLNEISERLFGGTGIHVENDTYIVIP